jgi:hypothetical protein
VLRFGKLMCVESWTVRCGFDTERGLLTLLLLLLLFLFDMVQGC